MKTSTTWQFITHPLDVTTPGFGGAPSFSRTYVRSMESGDSSNSETWTFSNHSGSHVDTPRHFSANGAHITDYAAHDWVFNCPWIVELTTAEDSLILPAEWCESIPETCDFLLIRTGFERFRGDERYWRHNPGIAPDMANWLRTHRKSVRAIGFDFISLTAFSHREIGRAAHRSFLCHETAPILIFEDLHLADCPTALTQVIALPIRVRGSDGSPVSIIVASKESH